MLPPQETALTEYEKNAYRYLLYQALVDVRNLCLSRGPESLNPLEWRRQYRRSRIAGALADWLHNLAYYAAQDFQGFDADWFWREYEGLPHQFSQVGPGTMFNYRRRYAEQLTRLENE